MVESVLTQLGLLSNHEGPTMGQCNSDFKTALFEKYAWFFRWPVQVMEGDDTK